VTEARAAEPRGFRLVAGILAEDPRRSVFLLACLLAAGLAEGVGFAALLPILGVATGDVGDNTLARLVHGVFAALGIAPSLGALLIGLVLIMTVRIAISLVALTSAGHAQAARAAGLRERLLAALLGARWSYFVGQPIGGHANAMGIEVDRAAGAYALAAQIAANVIQVVVYLAVALLLSWRVTLLAAAAAAAIVATVGRLIASVRRTGRQQAAAYHRLLARMTDGLQGIKPLRAMAAEDRLHALLRAENETLHGAMRRFVAVDQKIRAAQEWLLIVLLALGLYAALGPAGAPLALVVVGALLFHRTVGRVNTIQVTYAQLLLNQGFRAALAQRIAAAEAARESSGGAEPAPRFTRAIRFEGVGFAYAGAPTLVEVSLSIPFGAVVALVGPSGAGKTTLADLLLGLYRPDRGAILVDDVPLDRINLVSWRREIGFVPQDVWLLHDTVRRNVTLGDPAIDDGRVRAALDAAGAFAMVEGLPDGLDTLVGERGARFSGGQRQRLAIARALVRAPRLLVLDEPTSALDADSEAELTRTVRALAGSVTVLAISHRPALVDIADVVVRMADGRVVAIDQRATLAASGS
jgi:ATP-binding cassette subfamily C protein